MALSTTEEPEVRSRRDIIAAIENSVKDNNNPTSANVISKTLGVNQALTENVVSNRAQIWANEAVRDSQPQSSGGGGIRNYALRQLAVGPVGGFLSIIQKPLAIVTSGLKEGIDLFTGQDASWNEFTTQVNENYGFGSILGDYDLLQGDGWQYWAAGTIGFVGDVAFDPLTYIGGVGFGVKAAKQVAKAGTREVAKELARKQVLKQVQKSYGDDALRGVSEIFEEVGSTTKNWNSVADDIGNIAEGNTSALANVWEEAVDEAGEATGNWLFRTPIKYGDTVSSATDISVEVSKSFIDDIGRVNKIGAKATEQGLASRVAGNDLRFISTKIAQSGVDDAFRPGIVDEFASVLGNTGRVPEQVTVIPVGSMIDDGVGGVTQLTNKAFRGADGVVYNSLNDVYAAGAKASGLRKPMATAAEAANATFDWGLKTPGTGFVGRKLRIADPIEKLARKVTKSGAQGPVGLKIMSSETPLVGQLVTGIPIGLRTGISKVGGLPLLKAIGKGSGKMGRLKSTMKESDSAVFKQQGKRVIHAVARGTSIGKQVKLGLMRVADDYLKQIDQVGAEMEDVFFALGGDAEAIAKLNALDPDLVANGREMMDTLRNEANKMAGSDFLQHTENYVPRQLDEELRQALFFADKAPAANKFTRLHKNYKQAKYSPKGTELARKYVATDSSTWINAVAKRAKDDGISKEAAARAIRRDGKLSDEFWGETLTSKDVDGAKLSVEKQIADQLDRSGADYSLFATNFDDAIKGWIKQTAHRVGETYTENLLIKDGILVDRMAEYVFLPTSKAVKAGKAFRESQSRWVRTAADLRDALSKSNAPMSPEETLAAKKQIEELEEIHEQALGEMEAANKEQDALFKKLGKEESSYLELETKVKEIDEKIKLIDEQGAAFEISSTGKKAVALEKERVKLVNKRIRLLTNDATQKSTLEYAFEVVSSGTIQRMRLEKALQSVFGDSKTFNNFVRDLGGANVSDLATDLRIMIDEGVEFLSVSPNGTVLYSAEGSVPTSVEKYFTDLEGILGSSDKDGLGVWLGVESELQNFVGNPASKMDFSLKRVDEGVLSASKYLENVNEFLDNKLPVPTPEKVAEAKNVINDMFDDYGNEYGYFEDVPSFAEGLEEVDKEAFEDALTTYFAGSALPVPATINSGKKLSNIVEQIDKTLTNQIDDIQSSLDILIEEAEQFGKPLTISYVWDGEVKTFGVRDYVEAKSLSNQMKTMPNSSQLPASPTRPSIDEILESNQIGEQLGSNPGGQYELNGKKYYIKQYEDIPNGGTGQERVTSEVLANAVYRELGMSAPDSYMSKSLNGGVYHVAPWIDDATTIQNKMLSEGVPPTEMRMWTDAYGVTRTGSIDSVPVGVISASLPEQLFRGFGADVLLANWDTVGMGFDNVAVGQFTRPHLALTRVDNGGTFFYRAQGKLKNAEQVWDFEDVSEFDSFLTGDNEYSAMINVAKDEVSSFNGLYADQVQNLLDVRAKFNGFDNFVRRFMPDIDEDDAIKFVEFLEVRLERMANSSGKTFAATNSKELTRQGLVARGFSQKVIEAAEKEGFDSVMNLNHVNSENQSLNLLERFNVIGGDGSWGDFDFLNATPSNIIYDVGPNASVQKLTLDVPLGAENVKIYGMPNEQGLIDAKRILNQLAQETDPGNIDTLTNELAIAKVFNFTATGEILADQFSRTFNADPDFFDEYLLFLKKRAIDNIVSKDMTAAQKKFISFQTNSFDYYGQAVEVLESAKFWGTESALKSLGNVSTTSYPKNVIVQKFANLPFTERLDFFIWRDSQPKGMLKPQGESIADDLQTYFLALSDETISNSNQAYIDIQTNLIEKRNAWSEKISDLSGTNSNDMSSDFDPFGKTPSVGKNTAPQIPYMDPKLTGFASGSYTARSLKAKLLRIHQRSLVADGYNASVWFNRSDAGSFQQADGSSMVSISPNFMLNNPMAVMPTPGSTSVDSVFDPSAFMNAYEKNVLNQFDNATSGSSSVENLTNPMQLLNASRAKLVEDGMALSKQIDLTKAELEKAKASVLAKAGAESRALNNVADSVAVGALVQQQEAYETAFAKASLIADGLYEDGGSLLSSEIGSKENLLTVLNILREGDNQLIRSELDGLIGATENLLDPPASGWSTKSLHKQARRQQYLDDVFESSFKDIGNNLQGPEQIVESLVAADRYVMRGGAKGFFDGYDKLHNLLRAYMILKPGFHGRNFMSATFMNHLAGMNWSSYRSFNKAYWVFQHDEAVRLGNPTRAAQMDSAMKKRGIVRSKVSTEHVQIVRRLNETGSLGSAGGQVASEFMDGAGAARKVKVGNKKINLNKINPLSSQNGLLQLSRNFGMGTETFVRGSLGFDTMLKGGTDTDAFDQIMKFHFDYDDLSDAERVWVKKLVPFYTWQRKNIPLMFEMAARRPEVFNRYMSAKKNIEQDLERPEYVADWLVRQGGIQTPLTYGGESMFIAPDMPFKSPLELLDPALKFEGGMSVKDRIETGLQSLASNITPLIKAPYEVAAKRDLWRGRNFPQDWVEVPTIYTMIPGLMPALNIVGGAERKGGEDGPWVMKDHDLHGMAQLLPTVMDARRLIGSEEKYEQRLVSNWISFFSGIGLRTNTKWEQQQQRNSEMWELRKEMKEDRQLGR